MVLPNPLPPHPRLLVRDSDWELIRKRVLEDGSSRALWQTLLSRAEAICDEPPVERVLIGRMLLMVSRQALERISVLAMVDRVSGDTRFGARAIEEILAICRFENWNPSHFLDTAEMCLAVSIGFDWLNDELTKEQGDKIVSSIIQKAIEPSLDGAAASNWWLTTDENWAQVCHGGLSAGAISIADRAPGLAETILQRALAAIPKVAASYAPDGAYPEGPMYWSYGTSYHVLLAAALERLSGSTHGVDAYRGFAESAEYINEMTAPSGDYFNYADCAPGRRLQAQLFWMADRYGHPEWLAHDLAKLETDLAEYRRDPSAQYWYYDLVSFALLWHRPVAARVPTSRRFWAGQGKMPVAIYRWGAANCFLGVKGGEVGLSHSHMDVGSFVFEADGERWAVDTGMQDYAELEAAGVDLWNEKQQDSQRWQVFRLGAESHNILRFEDRPQLLARAAPLYADGDGCNIDVSALYGDPIKAARRQFVPRSDGFTIKDSWSASSPIKATIQWLTLASLERIGESLVLHQHGKELHLECRGPDEVALRVDHFDKPLRPFDAPNIGLVRLSFVCRAAAGSMELRASIGT